MSIPQTAVDRLIKQLLAAQATAAKFRFTDARGGYIDSQLGSIIADLQNGQFNQYDK